MFFLLCAGAFGQQRPLVTEDPRTLSEGAVVSELGFSYFDRARFPVSGLEGSQLSLLVNGLHIGIGDRAEFQLQGVLHNFVWLTEGRGRRNDWGDFAVSTKIRIMNEDRWRPIVSFRPTVVLPNTNNEKGLGTDGTHFFGSLLLGKSVGDAFIFGNVGLGILDDAVRAAAQQDVLTYGLAATVPLTRRIQLAAEWNGLDNPQDNPTPGGEDRGQIRVGLQLNYAGLRWDLGATAGLTRFDPRAGLVAGFTKEFRAWR